MNESESNAGTPERASSLHEVDMPCEQEPSVERRWWGVEYMSDAKRWTGTTDKYWHETDAVAEMDSFVGTCPARVVVVVERRTEVVRHNGTQGHIDGAQRTATAEDAP